MKRGTTYCLRVRGHLGTAVVAAFDGAIAVDRPDGVGELRMTLPDQAALHGVLARVRDLGLPLLSVDVVDDSPGGVR